MGWRLKNKEIIPENSNLKDEKAKIESEESKENKSNEESINKQELIDIIEGNMTRSMRLLQFLRSN